MKTNLKQAQALNKMIHFSLNNTNFVFQGKSNCAAVIKGELLPDEYHTIELHQQDHVEKNLIILHDWYSLKEAIVMIKGNKVSRLSNIEEASRIFRGPYVFLNENSYTMLEKTNGVFSFIEDKLPDGEKFYKGRESEMVIGRKYIKELVGSMIESEKGIGFLSFLTLDKIPCTYREIVVTPRYLTCFPYSGQVDRYDLYTLKKEA